MRAEALAIPGCYLLTLPCFPDARGEFRKLLHAPSLQALGLETDFVESYVSVSHRGVLRGLHFQLPPSDHAKLVSCLTGRARDGLLDLRRGSPTYGQSLSLMLDGAEPQAVYVPRGVAHGFAAHRDGTALLYYTTSVHDPARDAGVHAESAGIDWWVGEAGIGEPLMSPRDAALPRFAEFDSPFSQGGAA
ncbi:dTDP-4-dehydrorhamnose 3,5-epimerase family protein [Achromobacter pestifer]|uniref:dTDP-4-dehydrorhamnose 3,5-epimerase n=1 Tax=Achromobacter pestifer TaxID=1353889 RepID=A0A6S6YLI3_9BURK|nr:dTDP-4-dehydrorhamnose 3,5-epimerase family protein [Achromobacter pestifer]CAB3630907.1 dTDP-4-dehydrorhamnose 3,5-epimerase [Achromobacter pestifer]